MVVASRMLRNMCTARSRAHPDLYRQGYRPLECSALAPLSWPRLAAARRQQAAGLKRRRAAALQKGAADLGIGTEQRYLRMLTADAEIRRALLKLGK